MRWDSVVSVFQITSFLTWSHFFLRGMIWLARLGEEKVWKHKNRSSEQANQTSLCLPSQARQGPTKDPNVPYDTWDGWHLSTPLDGISSETHPSVSHVQLPLVSYRISHFLSWQSSSSRLPRAACPCHAPGLPHHLARATPTMRPRATAWPPWSHEMDTADSIRDMEEP